MNNNKLPRPRLYTKHLPKQQYQQECLQQTYNLCKYSFWNYITIQPTNRKQNKSNQNKNHLIIELEGEGGSCIIQYNLIIMMTTKGRTKRPNGSRVELSWVKSSWVKLNEWTNQINWCRVVSCRVVSINTVIDQLIALYIHLLAPPPRAEKIKYTVYQINII